VGASLLPGPAIGELDDRLNDISDQVRFLPKSKGGEEGGGYDPDAVVTELLAGADARGERIMLARYSKGWKTRVRANACSELVPGVPLVAGVYA